MDPRAASSICELEDANAKLRAEIRLARAAMAEVSEIKAIHRRWQTTELSDAGAMCEIAIVLYKTEKQVEGIQNIHPPGCQCEDEIHRTK